MKLKIKGLLFISLVISLLGSAAVFGQKSETVDKFVRFARGANSSSVSGTVASSSDSHTFHIVAAAGQKMTIEMTSARPPADAYLCVTFPDETQEEFAKNDCTKGQKRKYSFPALPRGGVYDVSIEATANSIPYKIDFSISGARTAESFFEGKYQVGDNSCTVVYNKNDGTFDVTWAKAGGTESFVYDIGTALLPVDAKGRPGFSTAEKSMIEDKVNWFLFDNIRFDTGTFIRADGKQLPVKRTK